MTSCTQRSSKHNIGESIEESIGAFAAAIDATGNLEIIGTRPLSDTVVAQEVIVLKNHDKEDGIEGRYVEVSIGEIIRASGKMQQLVDVILCARPDIVLHGITRIVGYYSRVTNWNKSKVGELRDRASSRVNGGYVLTKDPPVFIDEALGYIDNLSSLTA